jgi:hypothetical protein
MHPKCTYATVWKLHICYLSQHLSHWVSQYSMRTCLTVGWPVSGRGLASCTCKKIEYKSPSGDWSLSTILQEGGARVYRWRSLVRQPHAVPTLTDTRTYTSPSPLVSSSLFCIVQTVSVIKSRLMRSCGYKQYCKQTSLPSFETPGTKST